MPHFDIHPPKVTALFIALSLSSTSIVSAAGYQLQERSTSGLGRAFAGEAVIADDASAIATNAASMLLLDGTQLSAGFSYVNPKVEISGQFAGTPTTDPGPAQEALVPYAYLSHRINKDLAIGLATHSRFGLSTDYSDSFLATPLANNSEIKTFYLSPKLAYQIDPKWSIGAGFDAIYTEGELTNSFPSALGGKTIAKIQGDDWSYGYNLGTIYQHSKNTRFGLAYYSQVNLDLQGDVSTQTGIPSLLPPSSSVNAHLESALPASLELSGYHALDTQWAIHGSLTCTGWSTFDELLTQTDNGNLPAVEENWKDVYRIAVGTTFDYDEKWTFRAGLAFDESPVRSAEYRTLRIPDSDRYWLSAGTTYHINEQYSVDFGYTHVFAKSVSISEGPFEGSARGHVNIVGLSLNAKF